MVWPPGSRRCTAQPDFGIFIDYWNGFFCLQGVALSARQRSVLDQVAKISEAPGRSRQDETITLRDLSKQRGPDGEALAHQTASDDDTRHRFLAARTEPRWRSGRRRQDAVSKP